MRESFGIDDGVPLNWKAGTFCMTAWSESVIMTWSFFSALGFAAAARSSFGSIPGTSVNFGRRSAQGGEILNGMRAGVVGAFGKLVGTGGPHEAGTRSEAGPPVPFGGR